ncbi:MAG: energy transducer TonB [Gemmatimonadetes bacterium]|nr:energy transducer TonB [Gemmatimonadota bacterium]
MFDILLESRHVRPPRPVVATALSAAFHAALFVALVGGTTVVAVSDEGQQYWDMIARMILPPDAQPTLGGEHVAFIGLSEQGSPDGQAIGAPVEVSEDQFAGEAVVPRKISQAVELDGTMQLAVAARSFGAFTLISLDSVAERDPLSAAPAYPRELLERNIEGSATFRFVIDSTGLVDLSTIRMMTATHQEFARAVREAMPRMRFKPAMRGADAVRQLVEQPYKFEINTPPPTS